VGGLEQHNAAAARLLGRQKQAQRTHQQERYQILHVSTPQFGILQEPTSGGIKSVCLLVVRLHCIA